MASNGVMGRGLWLALVLLMAGIDVAAAAQEGPPPAPEVDQPEIGQPREESPQTRELRRQADELARSLADGVQGFAELLKRDADRLEGHAEDWSRLGEQLIDETERLLERALPPRPPERPQPDPYPRGPIEI